MLDSIFALLSDLLLQTSYVDSLNCFPQPLSRAEETELLERFKGGDISARDKLIEHNMRLVVHIAKKYANYPDPDELISVGSIGLIKAVNTFAKGKGTQLATYAARCIDNEILMTLRANKKLKNNKSIYDPISFDKEGNEITLIDIICTDEDSVMSVVENSILGEKLAEVLQKSLTDREEEIIKLRYGLFGNPALTQLEIAGKFKISRSYVSRIEKKALAKIRKYLESKNIKLN